jgi:hypothetical protein
MAKSSIHLKKFGLYFAALLTMGAMTAPAQAQSNFTFDESRWVLIDNQNGREWPCGKGFAWLKRNGYTATYTWAKNTAPGVYSAGPYGSGGGWRLPTTAELADALNKGLYAEMQTVAQYCFDQQAAAGITPGHPEYINFSVPGAGSALWVNDPKTVKQWAYYLVLGTGERVKTVPASMLLFFLVR